CCSRHNSHRASRAKARAKRERREGSLGMQRTPVKGSLMPFLTRLRRPGTRNAGVAALTVALAVLMAACGQDHPDSIFHQRTDFNREVDYLFKLIIWLGTAVFIFVEGILILTLIKYRKRPGQPEP